MGNGGTTTSSAERGATVKQAASRGEAQGNEPSTGSPDVRAAEQGGRRLLIRPATAADLPALVALGEVIHAETRLARFAFDGAKLARSLAQIIGANDGRHCLFIADAHGRIAGLFFGYVAEYFFSRARVATDIMFYVHPDYRGTAAALKLVLAYRKWAQNRQVDELCINMTTGIEIEKFDRFLRRMGFGYVGGNYSMWLDGKP